MTRMEALRTARTVDVLGGTTDVYTRQGKRPGDRIRLFLVRNSLSQ
jgi:hypothetical protein